MVDMFSEIPILVKLSDVVTDTTWHMLSDKWSMDLFVKCCFWADRTANMIWVEDTETTDVVIFTKCVDGSIKSKIGHNHKATIDIEFNQKYVVKRPEVDHG